MKAGLVVETERWSKALAKAQKPHDSEIAQAIGVAKAAMHFTLQAAAGLDTFADGLSQRPVLVGGEELGYIEDDLRYAANCLKLLKAASDTLDKTRKKAL